MGFLSRKISQLLLGVANVGEMKFSSVMLSTSVISSVSKCGGTVGGKQLVSISSLHIIYKVFELPIGIIEYLKRVT